jgi:hypothetical protein
MDTLLGFLVLCIGHVLVLVLDRPGEPRLHTKPQ